ncbi:MAG: hypothetical protein ACE5EL_00600 [Anaerolineae bacterium]
MSPTAQPALRHRGHPAPSRRLIAAPIVALGAMALVSIAVASGPTALDATVPGYRLEGVWPASAHGLPAPFNVYGAPDGSLWVMDASAGEAVALDATGAEVGRAPIPADGLDLAVGPTGDLFLGRWSARPLLRAVSRYDGAGVEAWTRECSCGTGSGIAVAGGRAWLTEPAAGTLKWMNTGDGQVSGLLTPPGAAAGFPADVDALPDRTLVATDLIAGAIYAWPPPYLPADLIRWDTVELSGPFRVAGGADDDGDVLVSVQGLSPGGAARGPIQGARGTGGHRHGHRRPNLRPRPGHRRHSRVRPGSTADVHPKPRRPAPHRALLPRHGLPQPGPTPGGPVRRRAGGPAP